MPSSVPDIMALLEVRTANEAGRAVLVLSPGLDDIRFANLPARALFAGDGDMRAVPAPPAQLRALAPLLAEDGEAMIRLKARSGDVEVWVTAHLLATTTADGETIALLTAPVPSTRRESPDELAERLLLESGRPDAAILNPERISCAGEDFEPVDLRSGPVVQGLAKTFFDGGEARGGGGDLVLWRVASEFALAVRQAARAANDRETGPLSMLVDRWRSRDGADTGATSSGDGPGAAAFEHAPAAASVPGLRLDRLGGEPVRFVWQIDAEGRFRQLSPEFAGVVGLAAADVLGLAFADVAEAFGFDETGEIGGLLERRETWSGRSIYWPVEGTDRKMLVDLAALPTYGRDRRFDGFRGFGIVRPGEHVHDPEAIGLTLVGQERPVEDAASADHGVHVAESADATTAEPAEQAGQPAAAPAFGRRPPSPADREARTVVSFEERRRRDALLSPAEEDAFRAIGAELSPLSRRDGAAVNIPPVADELKTVLAAVPAALLVERQGQLVLANPAFLQLTRYDDLDALVAAGGLDALFAESLEEDRSGDTMALRRADGVTIEAHVQMQRARLSGQACLVFSFAAAQPAPVAEDTSELEALQDEVVELRSVLDTATDGILLLDLAGAIRAMNGSAESLLGVDAAASQGRSFTEYLAPESRQAAQAYFDALADGGLAGILNDGREVMAEVEGRGPIPVFLTIGRLSGNRGWCVLLRDIAHWKRVEEELVAARRQAEDASLTKSRFLANISHELRTPLNAIIGFADVMAAETYGPIGHERYLEYLRDIKRSGHHVLDLVNDLLDISKIEAGKVELSFEAVSLNEVVGEVVSLMQPQANRQRVLVRSNLPLDVPAVVADRRTLRQIALNLIANAIRFTPAGGQIIASTGYGENGEVLLRFRDSGIGMTDREIEIALTPFQQVNASSQERGEGTGLGLPLTKAMVEANRAQFNIASTPGEGTLIEITFPAQRVLAH